MTTRQDFLWILVTSTLIMLCSSLATWAGYQTATQDLRFRGIFYDSQDYAVHIASMEAGRHGEWAYQFRFTTEAHQPAYIRLFYLVLGHLSQSAGLTSERTFELARWLLGFAALYALYRLMQRVFPTPFWARTAFLLAALGSGLGWLQLIFNWTSSQITPIDFWLIDAYVFFSLSVFPHFAFVTAGMCIALMLWLDFIETRGWNKIAWIGLTAIAVQFVNPIAFAVVDIALAGAAIVSWWNTRKVAGEVAVALFVIAIVQIPLFAYNLVILSHDPLWSQFTAQNQTLSPPPDYYLWGFAWFWLPAITGVVIAFRKPSNALGAAVAWIISAFLLAYAPVEIQRRFLQNITIPLAILATAGLMASFESKLAHDLGLPRWKNSLVILFVCLASVSSIQLILGRTAYIKTLPEELYYPASLDQAIHWFHQNAQYNDFVLASEATSQVLAQKAGLRVYLGHEMETLNYKTKKMNVQDFFEGELGELARSPIKWVAYGPYERRLSPDFQPPPDLELVYQTQELQIFSVR